MPSTATQAQITEFLSYKNIALIRPSRSLKVQGVLMDEELRGKGYSVNVVYLDETASGVRLKDLKEPVESVIIAVPPAKAALAVQEAVAAGISRVWLQQGAESPEALELCRVNNVSVIHGACVLMYAGPVLSFHAFHRWLWKIFGLLAK